MADIDDELLALAGEASSDEEGDAPTSKESMEVAECKPSVGTGAKKADVKKASSGKESEEEGEAVSGSSSPASLKSAPMDESESDSDPSPANFSDEGERYPLDGKFMNSSDKASIMAMPEIQREQVLAERAQEVETSRQNRALRQLLNAREAENKKQDKKRKAGTAELDDTQRKTSRQRTKLGGGKVGEASTGIDNLKRARAEKTDRQRRRDEELLRNPRSRAPVQDDYSEDDAQGESEVEWEDTTTRPRKSRSPDYRNATPANLDDVNGMRAGRSLFGIVCFYPGFEETILGTFARIVIGVDKETNQNIYRVGVIKGFVEDKVYVIEAPNGKKFRTTQYIRAAHGKAERTWPFITCSDSRITEGEWNTYQKACQNDGVPLPTKPKAIQKASDIHGLVNRKWTEAELQEKLRKSGALQKKLLPMERDRLNALIQAAQREGNEEEVIKLHAELTTLEGPKAAFNSLKKQAPVSTGPTQQERLAELNRQNRRRNIEEVRQAQINERRAAKRKEAAIARGEVVVEDHSRRVKTIAKFKYDAKEMELNNTTATGSATASGTVTPSTADAAKSKVEDEGKKLNSVLERLRAAKGERKGLGQIRRPLMDDDIIGAIDLGIDIEI